MNALTTTKSTLDLGISGVSVTQNALVIADDAPRASLEKVGQFLGTVEGSRQWWHGDYVNALRKFRGEHYGAAEAALAMGIDEKTLYNAVSVAGFFPPETRVPALSWTHHQEAMAGAGGDLAVAQNWLQKAVEEKWSTRDLREAIRSEEKPSGKPSNVVDLEAEAEGDPGPVRLGISDLRRANAWARERLEAKWKPDPETAREIIESVSDLRDLLDRLTNLAAEEEEDAA